MMTAKSLKLSSAVSDELLLMDADWEGRECWVNYLLEVKRLIAVLAVEAAPAPRTGTAICTVM